jgi:hypothetical protein
MHTVTVQMLVLVRSNFGVVIVNVKDSYNTGKMCVLQIMGLISFCTQVHTQ